MREMATNEKQRPKFDPGQICAIPGTLKILHEARQDALEFIRRHICGDWGDVCSADRQANEEALKHGFRLLSAYKTRTGAKLWIITEADRSLTTILLPDEY